MKVLNKINKKLNKINYLFFSAYLKLGGSFSQYGEDLIINKLLQNKNKGFYIDIGANDPYRFNNTAYFYKKNWSGINIEPNINKIIELKKARPKDLNLNLGVSSKKGFFNFYIFEPDTLSTFSKAEVKSYKKMGKKLVEIKKIKTNRLENILKKYCKNKKIDFISIDTEGYDLEVLKSNNWTKFRPRLICIENKNYENTKNYIKKYDSFFKKINYLQISKTDLNSIYSDQKNS